MRHARIPFIGEALVLLVAIGLTIQYARTAPAPERATSPESQSLLTYRNDALGFAVRYNPSLISFEENFPITPVARPWFCKSRERLTGEYLASQPVPAENCREPSFIEFVNFVAPKGVQTIFSSASQTSVVMLRSQTLTTNAFGGKRGNRDTYRIFVEATRDAREKAWALDLYLVPRKGTLLCKDKVCDIGEESPEGLSYCKADCPNGKDWDAVLKGTFETLKFFK